MEIDRNNYESWFLDFMDGNLDAARQEQLLNFLGFNPDLAEEFEGMESAILQSEPVAYGLKSALRKPSSKTRIGEVEQNFEGFCISYVENQLSAEEEMIVKKLAGSDSERTRILDLYASTRIVPDQGLGFPKKSRLKKYYIFGMPSWITAAAAAAVLILISLPIVLPPGEMITENRNIPENGAKIAPSTGETQGGEKSGGKNTGGKTPESGTEIQAGSLADIVPTTRKPSVMRTTDRSTLARIPEEETKTSQGGHTLEKVLISGLEPLEAGRLDLPAKTMVPVHELRLKGSAYRYVSMEIKDPEELVQPNEKRFTLWRLADASVRKISRWTEVDYSLERDIDKQGNTRRFTFETPNFGISAPTRKPDQPKENSLPR